MAQRDLDAALQLLANRAQYITGASGAAIALRCDGTMEMLCRASAGANAPELGALFSMELGLSGESVRTKRALRCDDVEHDARVNREVCKQLGIASVVVMPVVNDDHVLGVFELFSEKANAFGERELSVVQRLSEMVEAAVRLTQTPEIPSEIGKAKAAAAGVTVAGSNLRPSLQPGAELSSVSTLNEPVKRPLFWSAPADTEQQLAADSISDESHVPPVLRDLKKCVACGFPISAGRMLCVECEEKKWRGQLRSQVNRSTVIAGFSSGPKSSGTAAALAVAKAPMAVETAAVSEFRKAEINPVLPAKGSEPADVVIPPVATETQKAERSTARTASEPAVDFVLSSGLTPSQSWLARNKYVLIVLLVIVAAACASFFLR